MSFLSKEKELVQFIESKHVIAKNMLLADILIFFSKVVKEAIKSSYKRLENVYWTNECVYIVYHI